MKTHIRSIIFVVFVFFLGSSQVFAQWTATGGPYGGYINRFKKAPNGNLYAVINQKLWRSTNNGDLWAEVIPTSPTSLFLNDIMIDSDGKLYAAYWSQFFSSSDNGVTWTTIATNIFQNVQSIERVGPDNVFVVWGGSGVYVSINKGVAWTQLSTLGLSGIPGLWANTAGDIFYAIQGGGLLKHSYQGLTANWSAANMTQIFTVSPSNVNSMAIDATSGKIYLSAFDKIYTSTNNGTLFTDITTTSGLLPTYGFFSGPMAIAPDGSISIFNSVYSKLHKSSNQGTSWTTTDLPTVALGGFITASPVFNSASTYFLATTEGVLRTTDTGATWAAKNVGITSVTTDQIAVANTTGRIILGKYGLGYNYSLDGGTTWLKETGVTTYTKRVLKLANGNILLYGSGYVWRSTNNAVSFISDNIYRNIDNSIVEAANGDLYLFYSPFISPNYLPKIARSIDSGATWTDLTITGLPASYRIDFAAIDGTTNMMISGFDYGTSTTKTFKIVGTTATLLTMPNTSSFNNLFFANNKFYVSQFSSYYTSANLGTNWTTVGFSGNYVFPIKNASYSGIAVSRQGALYISQDDGGTWSNTTLPSTTAYITNIAADAAGDYYASASGSVVLKFTPELLVDPTTLPPYINFNWQPLNGPYGGNVSRIEIHPDGTTLFAVSQNALWKYDGTKWTKLQSVGVLNTTIYDVDIDAIGNVYVVNTLSSPQKIHKSTDLGATWTALSSNGLPADASAILDIEVQSNSILAFGNFGGLGRIYKSSDGGGSFTERFTSAIDVYYGEGINRQPIVKSNGVVAIINTDVDLIEGMVVSTDFGTTWTVKNTSAILEPAAGFVGSYMFDKDGNILMHVIGNSSTQPFTGVNIVKSTDDGTTWTVIPTPTQFIPNTTNPYSKRIVTLGTGEYLLCTQSIFDCYRSTDGGATWTLLGNVGDVFLWTATSGTTSYVLGSGNAGILKTTNGGQTFVPMSNGISHPAAVEINLSNNKDLVIGATRPYYSSDFGQTFSLATLEPAAKYLQVKDSLIGYGSRLLLGSKNGGKTWKSFGTDRFFTFLTADATGNGFYGSDSRTLNYSTDLINWTNIDLSDAPTVSSTLTYTITSMVIDNGGIIFAVVRISNPSTGAFIRNDVYKIVFGQFIKISSSIGSTNPANIRYFNNKIYLYDTRGIIYRSSDGEIWTQGSAPAGNSLVVANNYLFITANNSLLWLSRNDGGSWQSVGDVPPSSGFIPVFRNVVINEYDGFAYATLTNSVAKKSANMVIPNDNTKPVATTFAPLNNATNVGLKPTLTVTFDEITNAVSGKKVRVFDLANAALPIQTLDMSTAVQNGKSWSIPTTVLLSFNKTYFVIVDAGAVADIFGNTNLGISSNTAWRFTTKAPPTVTAVMPLNNATGIAINTILKVTFSEPLTGVAAKNISIYKSSNATTPVLSILASTGVLSGNDLTFTVPSVLEYGTSYFVKADASTFQTVEGAAVTLVSLNTDWVFTTKAAPTVVSTTPSNNSSGVALTTSLAITLSESITLTGTNKLYVNNTAAPATPVATINLSDATVSGATATFTLPAALSNATQYDITIDPNSFKAVSDGGTFSVLTAPGGWQFTTVAGADTKAPVITYTLVDLTKGGANKIQITVDDTATGNGTVTGASLWYRGISSKASYSEVKMTLNTSINKWEVAIDEAWLDGMGLDHYFTASDNSLNAARLPASPGIFSSNLTFSTPPSITSGLVKFGGTESDYRIISIPYKLSDAKVSTIFNEVNNGNANKKAWRLLTFGGGTKWNEYPGDFLDIATGKGYWINVLNATEIKIEGATTPDFDRLNLYSMTLAAGWNQIGNPYTIPISWNEIKTQDANVGPLKVWNGTGYDNRDILNPFEGGFVFVNGPVPVTVKVTFPGIPIGGRAQSNESVSSDLENGRWQVPFVITQGLYSNNLQSGVGMSDDSNLGFDKNDDLNAPRFLNYLEMNFSHPEHVAKRFARDVVPVQSEYTWEFTIDSNMDGPAVLQWDNTGIGNNANDLFLLDAKTQTLVNMRETNRYSFTPKESSSFKLFFGINLSAKIKPSKILLGQAYPNPTQGIVTFPFSLPDESPGYQVSLEVFDMMGKKVNTIIKDTFVPGFYNSEWDPSLSDLSNGIYTYRLEVSSPKGVESQSGKIMIRK